MHTLNRSSGRITTIKRVLVLLIIVGMISIISCKSPKEQLASVRTDGLYGYVGTYFEIPLKDGYTLYDIGDIFLDNDTYCVSVVYSHFNSQRNDYDYITDIISIDQQGNITFTLEILAMQIVRAVFEQEYAYFAYSNQDLLKIQNGSLDPTELKANLVFFDKKTGNTTRVIHPGINADSVFLISNGFILTGENNIEMYTSDGQLEASIQTDFSLYPKETRVFETENGIYLSAGTNELISNYYKLDFDSSSTSYIMGTDSFGSIVDYCAGLYFFDQKGEYKVDLKNMQIHTIALWNEIDIRPKKTSDSEQKYVALDDEHFAIKMINMDGTGEIGFFTYDNSLNVNRTKIVVGGYDVSSDETLKWAVYKFNTQHDSFRIVLEDYSADFSYSTPQEAQTARLKLMKYFNEGHSPDIFYGESFDYQYWGREGIVMDLFPFFELDSELSMSNLLPGVQNVLMPDGKHCYSVFSGFHLSGYYGFKSDFPDNEVSLSEILFLSETSDRTFTSAQSSPCIAVEALSYNFQSYWGAYNGNKSISQSDIEGFVSNVIQLGIDPTISWGSICYLQDVHDGQYYLASGGPIDVFELDKEENKFDERITYIGYPSIEGSVHLVRPVGMVGISSSTKYPDQCWEFVRELLNQDIQKKVVLTYSTPVNSEIFELMCQSAINPNSVTDEDMKCYVLGHSAVSKDAVDDYHEIVNSIDTLYTSDWGAYNIIDEEITSYYTQERSVEQIADTLDARLSLYVQENYS